LGYFHLLVLQKMVGCMFYNSCLTFLIILEYKTLVLIIMLVIIYIFFNFIKITLFHISDVLEDDEVFKLTLQKFYKSS